MTSSSTRLTSAGKKPTKRRRGEKSSTRKGGDFEAKMYAFFETELKEGRLGINPAWSEIFRKKGYYSKDRSGDIVFDISIEVTRPGAAGYMYVFFIECKDYGKAIPVDDVEEFWAKVTQVSGLNAKAIFSTTAAFQQSALRVAASKGMGVLRYFSDATFKWELQRSPAASLTPGQAGDIVQITKALSLDAFKPLVFDFFAESGTILTSSPWDFFRALLIPDIAADVTLGDALLARPKDLTRIPFITLGAIEEVATEALDAVGYAGGVVPLELICEREAARSNLQVIEVSRPDGIPQSVLASITFAPPVISLFPQDVEYSPRARFTLAHELGHYQLGHGQYMRAEVCEADDLEQDDAGDLSTSDIARLEWQANCYASCILMPRAAFTAAFRMCLVESGIKDRGFGQLYLDQQPCNVRAFYTVASELGLQFRVSKTAVRLRLAQLGLLVEARKHRPFRSCVGEVMREMLDVRGLALNPAPHSVPPSPPTCEMPEVPHPPKI